MTSKRINIGVIIIFVTIVVVSIVFEKWGIFVDVLSIVLALSATAIAWIEVKELLYQKRLSEFELLNKTHTIDQTRIRKAVSEYNKTFLKDEIEDDPYLYFKDGWMHMPGSELVPLNNDNINLIGVKRELDSNAIRDLSKKILPRRNLSFVDNLRLFSDSKIFDAPSYIVCGINTKVNDKNNKVFNIKVAKEMYFDFVNSCQPFEYEAAHCIINNRASKYRYKMPLREKNDVYDFSNRSAIIGTVTLVALLNVLDNDDTSNYFFLHSRSNNVSGSTGLFSTVPAGFFQPSNEMANIDLSEALKKEGILHTIVREFAEEVFSVEEFTFLPIFEDVSTNALFNIMEKNVYFLGCGVNPVDYHLEVISLAVLDFNDNDVKERFSGRSVEEIKNIIDANDEGRISLKPLKKEQLFFFEKHFKSDPAFKQICKVLHDDFDNIMEQIQK